GGRGVVPDDHPLGFTCAAGYELWSETDVLLGLGSRLELQWFRWPNQPPDLAIVNVDVDPEQHERLQATVGLVADAAQAAAALTAALRDLGVERRSRHDELEALK